MYKVGEKVLILKECNGFDNPYVDPNWKITTIGKYGTIQKLFLDDKIDHYLILIDDFEKVWWYSKYSVLSLREAREIKLKRVLCIK